MSQENVEIVRCPVAVGARTRRSLEERLALRFPRAIVVLARRVQRLPPRSRLRLTLIRLAVRRLFEAANRSDLALWTVAYHPDCEATLPPQLASLGVETRTSGRESRIRFQKRWLAEWNEFRLVPEELVTIGGDRGLLIGRITGSGLSSGAAFDSDWAVLFTFAAGQAIREQAFLDHTEALQTAGLSE